MPFPQQPFILFQAFLRGIETLLRSAFGAVLLTILATLIGLIGGLYASELRGHYPWCVIEERVCRQPTTVWRITAFYVGIAIFAVLFYIRERANSIYADRREQDLLSAIRTMPPANVMQSFEVAYKIFQSRVEASNTAGSNALNEIDESIRNGLDAMTVIAADFQRVPRARYAANIMLYRALSDISEKERPEILVRLGPFLDRASFDGLDGILELLPELSASTDDADDTFDPDPSLEPMALPVPMETKSKNNGQKRYLPGGPTALIESRYLVDDTHSILADYDAKKDYDLPRSIFQYIDDYFRGTEKGQNVRSFMSLMLYYRKPGVDGDEVTIGAVNIHSNRVNLFANRELAAHYESLCQPFVLGLATLILNRKRIQAS